MRHKPPKIEMRIVNVRFPRFVIVDRRRYWTGHGWSRKLCDALVYAHADLLRDDIEMLKKNCSWFFPDQCPLVSLGITEPVYFNNRSNTMDRNERERLTKAHQCAQLLLADVREVHAKTDSVALEELMVNIITQVTSISRLLKRLSEQK